MTEAVNHPAHYGGADNTYEAIKVIEAWQLGFCLGNAVKYISRAGKKGDALEDLPGRRREVGAVGRQRPVQPGPVRPPVVVLMARLAGPYRVVRQAQLVAGPDDRHASPPAHDRMDEEHPGQGQALVLGRRRGRQATQLSRGPADAPVAGLLVVLEDQAGRR